MSIKNNELNIFQLLGKTVVLGTSVIKPVNTCVNKAALIPNQSINQLKTQE